MCLSFPVYYPEVDLGSCGSTLANVKGLFVEFANKGTPRIRLEQSINIVIIMCMFYSLIVNTKET